MLATETRQEYVPLWKRRYMENRERIRDRKKQHYAANREEICAKVKARYKANPAVHKAYIAKRLREWKAWCRDWKAKIGCTTCGERNPVCLDFHHLSRATKKSDVLTMAASGAKMQLEEVMKCVVVCANCHRKVHALEKTKEESNED